MNEYKRKERRKEAKKEKKIGEGGKERGREGERKRGRGTKEERMSEESPYDVGYRSKFEGIRGQCDLKTCFTQLLNQIF